MSALDDTRSSPLHPLLEVGRSLFAELDPEAVLDRVLHTAREITGARYAALGILDQRRSELERFITVGLDDETRQRIGDLPHGRGVLGVLIDDPHPLRLNDVGMHPHSYGFPAAHPVMQSFLGVPIMIRGEAFGNLYLADKQGGPFDEADEQAAVMLAGWAAVAIENARLYQLSEDRRFEVERAVRGLEASRDVALAIGSDIDLDRVLELIAKRGRALVGARSLIILLREGAELVARTSAGYATEPAGLRVAIEGSTSGEVLRKRQPERIGDVRSRLRITPEELGVTDASTALLVPMLYRGDPVGILAAFDRGEQSESFSEDDEQVLRMFASSAATAVVMAQSVQADRLRGSLEAADAERRRWARELHDETLQALGALRVLLASALRRGDPQATEGAVRDAVGYIEHEIESLRAIITELRPAALDELGLRPAIEALVERQRTLSDFSIEAELELPEAELGHARRATETETTVYRLVQEALSNAAKHSRAERVRVAVAERDGHLSVEISDDGRGFDTTQDSQGFGLVGMKERVHLAGGRLEIDSGAGGTTIRAQLPAPRDQPEAAGGGSAAQQA